VSSACLYASRQFHIIVMLAANIGITEHQMTDTTIPIARGLTRWQASGIHLLISAAIAAGALFITLRVWYPPPLFTAEGGSELLFILVAVDVVIGPLITLVIFKSGKPGLRFDLSVIALFQACALVYGCHVMFVARPVFIVLAMDQFETVRANDLDAADLAQAPDPAFRSLPLTGPVFVAVELPKDMKQLREIIAETQKSGKIVTHLPRYYVSYAQHKTKAVTQSRALDPAVKRGGDFATLAQKFLAESGRKASDLNYIELQTRRGFGAVLIDAKSGEIVTLLPPKL